MRRSPGSRLLPLVLVAACSGSTADAGGTGTDTDTDTNSGPTPATETQHAPTTSTASTSTNVSDTQALTGSSSTTDAIEPPVQPPPVCSITLECGGVAIPNEPKIPCTVHIEDGLGGIAYTGAAGVERRGRSSLGFPKPQYAVELRVSAVDETETPINLFEMGREADWVLNGAYIDRALIRNKLLYELFQSFGGLERYAPESVYCELTLDGDYRGLYLLTERIKRDDDRVALPADLSFTGASFLIKQDDEGGIRDVGIANGSWRLVYPRQGGATPQQIAGVVDWLDAWSDVVTGVDTTTDLFSLVDLDSAVDLVLLEEFAKNNDAYYLSLHVWKAPGGLLHFTPWDLDLSFGQPNYNMSKSPLGWVSSRPALIDAMVAQPEFRARLASRWHELRADLLSETVVFDRLDFHLETIAGHVAENFERWPIADIQFFGDQLYPVASYEEEVDRVRTWIAQRLGWMDNNIDDYITR